MEPLKTGDWVTVNNNIFVVDGHYYNSHNKQVLELRNFGELHLVFAEDVQKIEKPAYVVMIAPRMYFDPNIQLFLIYGRTEYYARTSLTIKTVKLLLKLFNDKKLNNYHDQEKNHIWWTVREYETTVEVGCKTIPRIDINVLQNFVNTLKDE